MSEYVIVLRGPCGRVDVRIRAGVPAWVGRHGENDLSLPFGSISRFHARIEWERGAVLPVVRDCGSHNGTFVDGRQATATEPVPLGHGSRLRLGEVVLQVTLEGADGAEALLPDADEDDEVYLATDPRPAEEGRLEGVDPVRRLLLLLEREERTGLLVVWLPSGAVWLTLGAGKLMHAWREEEGGNMRALRRLLEEGRAGQRYRLQRTIEVRDGAPLGLSPTAMFRELDTSKIELFLTSTPPT